MKVHQSLIALLLLTLFTSGVAQGQSDDTPLARGKRALDQADYKTAREALEIACQEDKFDTAAVLLLTEVYIRERDFRKAQQTIDDGVKNIPNSGEIYLKQGIVRTLRGDYSAAIKAFGEADDWLAAHSPERASLYINWGIAISNGGKPSDAIEWFDKAIEIAPRNVSAYIWKGTSLFRMGDYAGSIAAYSTSIEIDRSNPLSFYNRGMAYMRNEDIASGCADLRTACQMGNVNACKAHMLECQKLGY